MSSDNGKNDTGQSVALTGATGFLGRHLIQSLKNVNIHVRALTRRPQKAEDGIDWIEGDLDNESALLELCDGATVVLHAGAVTKALSRNDFFDSNVRGTKNILNAAKSANVDRFILVSSLAAREPQLSHYAASKSAAELAVSAGKWPFKWTIIRPPAIYGPGDMEILKIFRAAKFGFLPALGSRHNNFSMIHVEDLCELMLHVAGGGYSDQILEVDDLKPSGYQMRDIIAALPELEKKPTLLTLPYPVLAGIGAVNELLAKVVRKPAILTSAKAKELCHEDWVVRAARRPTFDGWKPSYSLSDGLQNTFDWYKEKGLL